MKDLTRRYLKLFKSSLRLRLKKFGIFFKRSWPFWVILLIVCTFFWKVFLLKQVPLPADFVVGVYYPWLDYKWGYTVGVPVKNPITTDVVSFTYPMRTLGVELLKSGQWPLWNPHILTGTPLLANFQSAPFIFTNIFYFLTDKLTAWSLQIVFQHFFAIIFTYILLRHWKLGKISSILGGVAFAFAGFNLIWSQWNTHTLTAAFIPLLLFVVDKYLITGEYKYGFIFSILLALQILAGYPQVVLYTFIALAFFWLVQIKKAKNWLSKTLVLGISVISGITLSAFQVLPGMELLQESQRASELNPYTWAFLPWSKVITFIAPDYFGNHATMNYWGPQDYTSNTGYVGVVAFILASLSIADFKKRRAIRFLVLLALISLVLAFPTPISTWIWESGFLGLTAASAHRALVLWNLAISLMAAFGLDYLLKSKKINFKFALFLPYLLLVGFGLATIYLFLTTRHDTSFQLFQGINKYWVGLRNLALPTFFLVVSSVVLWLRSKYNNYKYLFASVLFIALIFELYRFGWKYTPFSNRNLVYPTTPVLEYLISQKKPFRLTGTRVIPMNLRMPYGLESPEGYDAVYLRPIAQFLASLSSSNVDSTIAGRYGFIDKEDSHLVDLMNTKFHLVLKRDEKGNPDPNGFIPKNYQSGKFEVVFEDKSVAVLESKKALERAFMVYDWEKIREPKEILNTLLQEDFPLGTKIILEEEPDLLPSMGAEFDSRVFYEDYRETKSKIFVDTEKDGFLFVSDSWYPGWKAYVDGKEEKIYKANYTFRGVPVPAGEHKVEFIYDPKSFKIGKWLSLTTAVFLIGALAYEQAKVKRKRITRKRPA